MLAPYVYDPTTGVSIETWEAWRTGTMERLLRSTLEDK